MHGRHEQHDQGVHRVVGENEGHDPLVGRSCRGSEHVHRIRDTRLRRQFLANCRLRLLGQRRQLQAGRLAGVGAQNSKPAGVRDDPDAASGRKGLLRKERRDVEQLFERVDAQHARLVKQGVDRRLGSCESSRVGARGLRARARAARLQREDRLASSDAPREPRELGRVAERLQVQRDHVGRVVFLPPFEEVVRRDVRLVPDRDERGEAELPLCSLLEHREPQRAALRREPNVSGRQRPRAEGCVQPGLGDGDPETVRSEQASAVRPHELEQLTLPLRTIRAHLREAGRDDAQRGHARLEGIACSLEHGRPRHADHGEVDGAADF